MTFPIYLTFICIFRYLFEFSHTSAATEMALSCRLRWPGMAPCNWILPNLTVSSPRLWICSPRAQQLLDMPPCCCLTMHSGDLVCSPGLRPAAAGVLPVAGPSLTGASETGSMASVLHSSSYSAVKSHKHAYTHIDQYLCMFVFYL